MTTPPEPRTLHAGSEARRRAYQRQQDAAAARRAYTVARLLDAYRRDKPTDPAYADALWGDMLRARGIDPERGA